MTARAKGINEMRYTNGAIILHWLIAVLIALNFAAAWVAEDMPKAEAMQIMGNHKAIGMTILMLTVVRILWRVTHKPPPFAPTITPLEARVAHVLFALFYFLMIAVPLMGWALHSAFSGGKPIGVFGLFSYPGLPMAPDKVAGETFVEVHGALATALLGLFGLHLLGALKHHFINRDGELRRMWFGGSRPS